ncbi:UNVERIFIED_CONTAM: hypothetical protein FKN15_060685 [Acipenser sinensis]
MQNELRERQAEIENLIEERLIELERLNQAVESLKLSAHKERAKSEQVLSELIRSIERIRMEVGELIGAKEKAAVSRANEQREQLEQEIQELRNDLQLLQDITLFLHTIIHLYSWVFTGAIWVKYLAQGYSSSVPTGD